MKQHMELRKQRDTGRMSGTVPGVGKTTISLVCALCLFSVLGALAGAGLRFVGIDQPAVLENAGMVIQDASLLLFCVVVARQAGLAPLSGPRPWRRSSLALALGLSLVGLMAAYGERAASVLLLARVNPDLAYTFYRLHAHAYVLDVRPAGYVWLVMAQFVFAPLAEEVLFRGVLLRLWARRVGMGWSIVLSSLLFAAFHFSKHLYVGTFVFSVLACLLYLAKRSMVANVLFHSANNVAAFVLEYVVNFSVAKPRATFQQASQWWPDLAMLVMALVGLLLLVERYWPRKRAVGKRLDYGRSSSLDAEGV